MKDSWFDSVAPVTVSLVFLALPATLVIRLAGPWSARPAYSEQLGATEAAYRKAVDQARSPDTRFVSKSLLGFRPDRPVTVVTWIQKGWLPSYQQADPKKTIQIHKDVWVTAVPFLKAFCQQYVRLHGADSEQLALRLKEHMGLPAGSDYDTFVELTVDPKDNARLLRPCGDSSVNNTSCTVPDLPNASDVWVKKPTVSSPSQEWVLRNYYSNYASRQAYPWTALGYTFDWALKADSNEFERYGETEFLIPKDDPVHFVSAASTVAYCTPP